MNKKVVFLFAPFLKHGGAEKQFRNLIDVLVLEEFIDLHVFVISSHDEGLINYYRSRGVKVYIYSKGRITSRLKLIHANFMAFLSMLKVRADVVYGYSLYITPALLIASFFCGKVIYSERILSRTIEKSKFIYRLLDLFKVNMTANSPSLIRFFQGFGCNAKLIPNSVEPVKFKLNPTGGYGVLARLSAEKNIHYLIENLSITKNLNLYYTAADERYKDKLISLSSSSCLSINFKGEKSLTEIYDENEILLHPSVSEGSPNVILEAMASRKPIFCSDIIENIETGIHEFFLFSLKDSGCQLNEKIATWLDMNDDIKEYYLDYNQSHAAMYSPRQFQKNVLSMVGF